MRIVYSPEGREPQTWDFEFNRLMNVELIAIEKQTGLIGLKELGAALDKGSLLALTGLVWVVQKRTNPSLPFGAVQFAIADLRLEEDEEPPDPKEEPTPDAGVSSEPSPNS